MPYREMWFIICLYTPRTYTEEINWQLNFFVIVYVNLFFFFFNFKLLIIKENTFDELLPHYFQRSLNDDD